MTAPDDTPKWLEALSDECRTPEGADQFQVPQALWAIIVMSNHYISPWATMASWLAWHSRVAEALGLVEPDRMTLEDWRARMGFTGADEKARNAAIASELRRLADSDINGEAGPNTKWLSCTTDTIRDWLRARADELDTVKPG